MPLLKNIPMSLAILSWIGVLLSPFLTTNILEYFVATDLLAFALALMAAAWMQLSQARLEKNEDRFSWWIVAGLLFPSFLILYTQPPPHPWGIYKFSLYILAVFLIFRMSRNNAVRMLNSTSWLVSLSIIAHCYVITSLLQMFHFLPQNINNLYAIWNPSSRFSGVLLQPNLTSLFLDIVIVSLWVQGMKHHDYRIFFFASILPLANVLISNSRSGFLVLFMACMVLFMVVREKKKFMIYMGIVFFIALMLAIEWNFILQQTFGNTIELGSRLYEGGFYDRISLWASSFYLFLEHPWLGIGYGNLSSYFAVAQAHTLQQFPSLTPMPSTSYWVHNVVLEFFTEGGVIGGLVFVLFLSLIIKRSWKIYSQHDAIHLQSFSSALIVGMIMMHGMVSISFFQGFFLSLLGLYLAGLFPPSSRISIENKNKILYGLYFLPSLYIGLMWYQFVFTQVDINATFDKNADDPQFIAEVVRAIDNPWLARAGLEYLLANMELSNTPAYQWVNVYPYIIHSWQLSQDPANLRRLILQAHLSGNALSEKYWGNLFLKAYPSNAWCSTLKQHLSKGHQAHESLRVNVQ